MQEIQLLKAIEQDARISVTDLADILNSTPEQVDGGMKKLAEEKVICGYHTVINWDKTNQDGADRSQRFAGARLRLR